MLMKAVHERGGGSESVIFIKDDYSQVYKFRFLGGFNHFNAALINEGSDIPGVISLSLERINYTIKSPCIFPSA